MCGEVRIQGSKNAALPILAASVLIPGVSRIANCPRISDVTCMCRILESIGCRVTWEKHDLFVDASSVRRSCLPQEYVTRMRSSVMLMGALLGRCEEVTLDYPGGCVIGDRPIDIHLAALKKLGVFYEQRENVLTARRKKLQGAEIEFPFPSVGATENAILAAVLAEGETLLTGCAREPEISALCSFLKNAGACIEGEGTGSIRIRGVEKLCETEYVIESDRIVAGTYLISVLAAGGEAFLKEAPAEQMEAVCRIAGQMGARLETWEDGIFIKRNKELISPGKVKTLVYPGFPTDLQSPLLVAMSQAEGESCLEESIFNGRFKVTEELNRMNMDIKVRGREAFLSGKRRLMGTNVLAQELRGGAALVIAGLCAEGITIVGNRHFIDRGYEDIVRDFRKLRAQAGN